MLVKYYSALHTFPLRAVRPCDFAAVPVAVAVAPPVYQKFAGRDALIESAKFNALIKSRADIISSARSAAHLLGPLFANFHSETVLCVTLGNPHCHGNGTFFLAVGFRRGLFSL